jgi:hypothetical protein
MDREGGRRRLLPSPAMGVAFVALLLGSTGGVYAAAQIGSGDIQDGAVKRNHLSKELKKPKVVNVAPASSADCSEVLEFCGPDGAEWVNYPSSDYPDTSLADNTNRAGYFVDASGLVHLQGTVAGGEFSGGGFDICFEGTEEIFFLPRKLWPSRDVEVPAMMRVSRRAGGTCVDDPPQPTIVEISDRGAVQLNLNPEEGFVVYLTLDGITFRPG